MIFQNGKRPFQAIRTRSSKSRKNNIFPKGLANGFGLKIPIFCTFFFQALYARKMSFMIFYNGEMFFQSIKTRSSKRRKHDIFPNWLTHCFGPKIAIFCTFFFQALQARKMSFMIFQNERTPFQAIKPRISKSQKIYVFPKGLSHGFGPKMGIFPIFFFRQYRPGNVFYDILERKKACVGYKNKKFKKSKN